MSSHLGMEPGLQVFAVLGGHGLVVFSDLGDDGGQVLLRSGVHLHVHLTSNLLPLNQQVLQENGTLDLCFFTF